MNQIQKKRPSGNPSSKGSNGTFTNRSNERPELDDLFEKANNLKKEQEKKQEPRGCGCGW